MTLPHPCHVGIVFRGTAKANLISSVNQENLSSKIPWLTCLFLQQGLEEKILRQQWLQLARWFLQKIKEMGIKQEELAKSPGRLETSNSFKQSWTLFERGSTSPDVYAQYMYSVLFYSILTSTQVIQVVEQVQNLQKSTHQMHKSICHAWNLLFLTAFQLPENSSVSSSNVPFRSHMHKQ